MQSMDIVVGFSDLKNLLIQRYQMQRPRDLIKLHFTERDKMLLMHDYDDHKKIVILSKNIGLGQISEFVLGNARSLVEYSLKTPSSALYLANQFLLNGFFRP